MKVIINRKIDFFDKKTFLLKNLKITLSIVITISFPMVFLYVFFCKIPNMYMFFCKKSRFLHTLEIIDFAGDNHDIYRKKFTFFPFFNHFPHSLDPDPPSLSVAGKTSKSAKRLPMGILKKTRKTRLSIVKRFLPKQHYQSGKVQKFAGRLRVKF